jgi:hypothetical protein
MLSCAVPALSCVAVVAERLVLGGRAAVGELWGRAASVGYVGAGVSARGVRCWVPCL